MPETPPPEATAVPDTPPEEPKKYQHSETILRVCDELDIAREQAELLEGSQLRAEIEDAKQLLQVRQAKRGAQPPAPAPAQPAPPAEEEVKLTADEEEELADRPATRRAILEGKRAAAQAAKLQRELENVRAQSSSNNAEQQVKRLLADVPVPAGMNKDDRDLLVMQMIAAHDRAGHFQGVPFDQAVILMQKKYAPAPVKTPGVTPTRVHTPTNRLNKAEQERLAAAAASNSAANNGFGEP